MSRPHPKGWGLFVSAKPPAASMHNPFRIPAWMPRLHLVAKRPPPSDYPKEPKVLGHHLLKRRFDLGLPQERAASVLGVAVNTLHNWEHSYTSPQPRFITRIHDFLGYCLLTLKVRPQLVQATVLHRLGNMNGADFIASGEVGDGSCHAKDSIHCPS